MTTSVALPYEIPQESLYAAGMVRTELIGVENARQHLGDRLKKANVEDDPVHSVVTKHGQPSGVVVGMDWYRQARASMEDPTDL